MTPSITIGATSIDSTTSVWNENTGLSLPTFFELMWAAAYGKDDTVGLLLDSGADPAARDNRGKSALTIAVEEGHLQSAARLRAAGAKE